jgi:hypothetical protein
MPCLHSSDYVLFPVVTMILDKENKAVMSMEGDQEEKSVKAILHSNCKTGGSSQDS